MKFIPAGINVASKKIIINFNIFQILMLDNIISAVFPKKN